MIAEVVLTDDMLALARRGKMAALRDLLDEVPELVHSAQKVHGRTLLWEAVRFGRAELVDFLLDRGAAVDAPGRHRAESLVLLSPLAVAQWFKRVAIAKMLRAKGAQLDIYNAAYLGDLETVEKWLEQAPELINRSLPADIAWQTIPLHFAASGQQVETARFLCARGSNVIEYGTLLLDIAARRGNCELVELFLECGADASNLTAFSVVVGGRGTELLPLLVERGLDVNGDNFGYPALVYASRGDKGEHPDWAEALLEHGADVNIQDRKGNTALHVAARAGFCALAKVLLAAGADPTINNAAQRTPLREAQLKKRSEVEALLSGHCG
jgi:uncharacterized protein